MAIRDGADVGPDLLQHPHDDLLVGAIDAGQQAGLEPAVCGGQLGDERLACRGRRRQRGAVVVGVEAAGDRAVGLQGSFRPPAGTVFNKR